jgi:AcrR family transcriptional regulator
MRVIAKQANISLAGLMHYFPTRDVLLTELQRDGDAKLEEWYRSSEVDVDPGEALARVMTRPSAASSQNMSSGGRTRGLFQRTSMPISPPPH